MTDREPTRRETGRAVVRQLPLILGLVVLWMMLWGTISWLSVVTGILVAFAVTRVFYLPPVELSGRFNVFWAVIFLVRFFTQLVVASVQVAGQAFRPRGVTMNAVIAVKLTTRSDLILTLTGIVISLIPGSIVLEADRHRSILYLHLLNTETLEEVERQRAKVFDVERRLVRVLGSREDMERMRA